MDCSLPGSSIRGDSPGKNAEVDCHALLQGIFPTQGSKPGLPHCRQILYCLSHQGNPQWSGVGPIPYDWCNPFSSGSSWPRNWTGVSCIAGRFFTSWATREAPGVGWALIQHDWYPYIKGIFGHRHSQGKQHVKMKAEIWKPRNTKDCQLIPEAGGEAWTDSSHGPREEPPRPLVSKTVRQYFFFCCYPVCGILL